LRLYIEDSPKTDYLTPMHELIITSTFFVVIATLVGQCTFTISEPRV